MASFEETGPRNPVTESIRVDKVHPRARFLDNARAIFVLILALIGLIPVLAMGLTAFKSRADVVAVPPKIAFEPTLEGFVFLLTERSQLSGTKLEEAKANADDLGLFGQIALRNGQRINGPSDYVTRLWNSLIIAGGSTIISVVLGLFAAYAFSRFDIPGKDDLLFFILSTRMLPAVVVTIPLFLMFRQLGLFDTHLGMILLYTVFNLSLTVWLLKGFIDEIPREYEEAALVDGYTRFQAFYKIVLPQAATGIAATTVFSLIFAWNEYAFALMLTSNNARTAPPAIATMLGRGGIEWSAIAAGTLTFLIPVVIITFALRRHLLRGVTFGAIRQ
ncbi:MAG TPA: carbohydrate ABC transporter permease [Anaerolineae bacterium]|nr:carbohydrate ABC transporter permease [Anaerolineae bacterium]MCB0224470.1 carbohydrate ABC transporter permease [Anaerolineae bacterium]MCB9108077.1 carbohydrate ABC transporter permease [Anaerolineales bacterium]HRV92510.1 carbohydrate ABC transporter permease [Anaerolineae bacterium]